MEDFTSDFFKVYHYLNSAPTSVRTRSRGCEKENITGLNSYLVEGFFHHAKQSYKP